MVRPVYFGQGILDLSKTLIYDFQYDYNDHIQPQIGSKVKLCYMDTNSFVHEIEL